MTTWKNSRLAAAALVFGVTLLACDQLPTESLETPPSQLVLRSSEMGPSFSTASLSLEAAAVIGSRPDGRNGPVDPGTISTVEVRITRIALLTRDSATLITDSIAGSDDDDDDASNPRWVGLELDFDADSTWFNLRNLAADSTLGTVPASVTGEIKAIRVYFGEARVLFKDGTTEALTIPRGSVTIPTRGVAVNTGSDVALVFERLTSFGRIIRTGNGLMMTPAFTAENGGRSKGKGAERENGRGNGRDRS